MLPAGAITVAGVPEAPVASLAGTAGLDAPVDVVPVLVGVVVGVSVPPVEPDVVPALDAPDAPDAPEAPDDVPAPEGAVELVVLFVPEPPSPPPPPHAATKTEAASASDSNIDRSETNRRSVQAQAIKKATMKKLKRWVIVMRMMNRLISMNEIRFITEREMVCRRDEGSSLERILRGST